MGIKGEEISFNKSVVNS